MRFKRWLFWSILAAVALLVAYMALKPRAVWVEAATVSRGPLETTVREEGETRVKDRYSISAPVAGYLRRIDLHIGDPVAAGQTLTQLEPLRAVVLDARSRAESEARIAAAQSAVQAALEQEAAARASADQAQADYARLQKLGHTDFVSREQLQRAAAEAERAAAALRSAHFNAEVARHEEAAARTRLHYSAATSSSGDHQELVPVQSPVAGSVLKLFQQSEGVVQAGQPLLEVGDPHALEVTADVLSYDAVKLQPGTQARLEGWGGPVLSGAVRTVEPVGFTKVSALGVDEQRVKVVIDIRSPRAQWQSLGDGYRVDAVFVLWSGNDVVQLPLSAVFPVAGGKAVFLIRDGRARQQAVVTGHDDGFMVEVVKGLQVGDQVVRHPDGQVTEGVAVTVR